MATRHRNKTSRRNSMKTRKMRRGGAKTGKQWTSAIAAASKTLSKTGSIVKARQSLKKQALSNARKLFGSVGEKL
jgi:hypothetical protein